jgi:hypothetical protein
MIEYLVAVAILFFVVVVCCFASHLDNRLNDLERRTASHATRISDLEWKRNKYLKYGDELTFSVLKKNQN